MQNYVLKLAEKEKKMKGPPNISDQNTPHQARNLGLTSQFPITLPAVRSHRITLPLVHMHLAA